MKSLIICIWISVIVFNGANVLFIDIVDDGGQERLGMLRFPRMAFPAKQVYRMFDPSVDLLKDGSSEEDEYLCVGKPIWFIQQQVARHGRRSPFFRCLKKTDND
ncbi:hypothetical protein ACOME3_000160 [Neoechinorhynchus agilis]